MTCLLLFPCFLLQKYICYDLLLFPCSFFKSRGLMVIPQLLPFLCIVCLKVGIEIGDDGYLFGLFFICFPLVYVLLVHLGSGCSFLWP